MLHLCFLGVSLRTVEAEMILGAARLALRTEVVGLLQLLVTFEVMTGLRLIVHLGREEQLHQDIC